MNITWFKRQTFKCPYDNDSIKLIKIDFLDFVTWCTLFFGQRVVDVQVLRGWRLLLELRYYLDVDC